MVSRTNVRVALQTFMCKVVRVRISDHTKKRTFKKFNVFEVYVASMDHNNNWKFPEFPQRTHGHFDDAKAHVLAEHEKIAPKTTVEFLPIKN